MDRETTMESLLYIFSKYTRICISVVGVMIYQPSVFLGWQPGETFCVARWGLGIGDHICFGKMLDENTTDLS